MQSDRVSSVHYTCQGRGFNRRIDGDCHVLAAFIAPGKPSHHKRIIPSSAFADLLLRKQTSIESIFDQRKNSPQIEHAYHRSPVNFLVNLPAGLVAHCQKPSLHLAAL